jgi:hypothetical protein
MLGCTEALCRPFLAARWEGCEGRWKVLLCGFCGTGFCGSIFNRWMTRRERMCVGPACRIILLAGFLMFLGSGAALGVVAVGE